mmetsp:Transcript_15640/g.30150  ORF Transcript_15640/g.30150 Transcript_15640/m.30150 type:complete len:394 (-) Transcript_15640:170-1351(-)
MHTSVCCGVTARTSFACRTFCRKSSGPQQSMGIIFAKHGKGKGKSVSDKRVMEERKRLDQLMKAKHGPFTPAGLPLPPKVHQFVAKEEGLCAPPGRVVIVGDVHGCCDELLALLDEVGVRPEEDFVILAGDLVNKGPKSVEVIRQARARGFWAVRGNHDEAALKQYEAHRAGKAVPSRWEWVKEMSVEDALYLHSLPFTLALPFHNVVVVHAGLVPGVRLEKQSLVDMTEMREIVQDGEDPDTGRPKWKSTMEKGFAGDKGLAWACQWTGPTHVVFGHDAKRQFQQCEHATGLDTGCVYGGCLAALVLPPASEITPELRACPPRDYGTIHTISAFKTYISTSSPRQANVILSNSSFDKEDDEQDVFDDVFGVIGRSLSPLSSVPMLAGTVDSR